MKKLVLICGLILFIYACATTRMTKSESVAVKIIIDSDPQGARIYDNYGVFKGSTPYTFGRVWEKQTWSDGDVIFWENQKRATPDIRGVFTGIASKDGYRKILFDVPYEFRGEPVIIRRTIFLRREGAGEGGDKE